MGLPLRSGPYRVISQLGVYGFDNESKRMQLLSVHPGVTIDQIKENSGFKMKIPKKISITKTPSKKELLILKKIDPSGMIIRK